MHSFIPSLLHFIPSLSSSFSFAFIHSSVRSSIRSFLLSDPNSVLVATASRRVFFFVLFFRSFIHSFLLSFFLFLPSLSSSCGCFSLHSFRPKQCSHCDTRSHQILPDRFATRILLRPLSRRKRRNEETDVSKKKEEKEKTKRRSRWR